MRALMSGSSVSATYLKKMAQSIIMQSEKLHMVARKSSTRRLYGIAWSCRTR
jgi:hypothetical protein